MSNSTSKWFKYLTEEKTICEMCGKHHDMEMCPGHDDDVRKVDHHDREGKMAKRQLYKIMNYAKEIHDNLHDDDELEGWVQSKIATMSSMIGSVKHYLEYEYKRDMHSLMEEEDD